MKIEWHKVNEDYICNTPNGCIAILNNSTPAVFIPGCHAVGINKEWHWKEIELPNLKIEELSGKPQETRLKESSRTSWIWYPEEQQYRASTNDWLIVIDKKERYSCEWYGYMEGPRGSEILSGYCSTPEESIRSLLRMCSAWISKDVFSILHEELPERDLLSEHYE